MLYFDQFAEANASLKLLEISLGLVLYDAA
jgi:hypothetical protein